VRVDLVERIARAAHEAREGKAAFVPDPALATSMGLQPATIERLMVELGFRPAKPEGWTFHGRRAPRREQRPAPTGAFAALAGWGVGA
jgi:ATP-dependent RNA helicase SUPV3L1/SUV3